MKVAAVSDLKAKLSKYLRIVKSGEEVEIRERGIPVAVIKRIRETSRAQITQPTKDPSRLSKLRFSVKPKKRFDIVEMLLEERTKR